uniref:Putative ovule protein n=1 Tax=Solanum chacoense TaxID=4108 RepID=A0A0V0I8Y7_SOLCH
MGCALAPCCWNCRTSSLRCSQVVMKMMRIMENGFSTEESMSSGTCNLQVSACGHFEVLLHGKQVKMEIICRNKLLDLQIAVLSI